MTLILPISQISSQILSMNTIMNNGHLREKYKYNTK